MILIADSGSTKTDWRLINGEEISQFTSEGLNPVHKSKQVLREIIEYMLSLHNIHAESILKIHFYGAGCMAFEKSEDMNNVLKDIFISSTIHVHSDILAAARATSFHKKGIVSILGTGANTCVFNGEEITYTRSGLGFILGDEGSGAHIGKTFVKALLDEEISEDIKKRFYKRFDLTKSKIIEATYSKPNPNLFYAQFSKYVFQLKKHPEVEKIILKCFIEFFDCHIIKISNYKDYTLHFVGSVAFYFSDYIRRIAHTYQANVGTILEKPIAGLTLYHQSKKD